MYVCTCIYVIIAITELHCSKHANKLPQLVLIKINRRHQRSLPIPPSKDTLVAER